MHFSPDRHIFCRADIDCNSIKTFIPKFEGTKNVGEKDLEGGRSNFLKCPDNGGGREGSPGSTPPLP